MSVNNLAPPPRAVLAYRASNLTIARGTTVTVGFDAVSYDHIGAWTPGNNSRVFVPTGARFVRIMANAYIDITGNGSPFLRIINKNGSELFRSSIQTTPLGGSTGCEAGPVASVVVAVKAGDYFSLAVWHNRGSGTGETLLTNRAWLAMEVVG